MSDVFEFLFKYRPALLEEGELAFLSPWPPAVVGAVAAACAVAALISYATARGRSTLADRVVLGVLRGAALLLLFAVLMQPALVLTSVVPQRNFLAVLIDDSKSMTIDDRDGSSRAEKATGLLAPEGGVLTSLSERFALRYFRYSSAPSRMRGPEELTFGGSNTRIGRALGYVQEELQGVPLSGIVVVSDGGDNSDDAIGKALLPLRAASVPVFTVGLGDEEIDADVQISRVDVPAKALAGSSLPVNVLVDARGYGGRAASIVVEDMGRIVAEEEVMLPRDGQPLVVPIAVSLEAEGARELSFRVAGQPGERVLENNELRAVVQVRDRTEKILYFEGEPRHEVAFTLRAIEDDAGVQVVLLQRTAENKFLRRNLDDPLELLGGFPTTREELYNYRALVLGSIEASFFTHDQLEMIAEFVGERGGTLLMLGGRRAFSEGGYKGTPLEDVLPVVLEEPDGSTPTERQVFVKVAPTLAGAHHPAARIAGTVEASEARWDSLPAVSTTNLVLELKPGATEFLAGTVVSGAGPSADRVVSAFQRYGRGRSIVLAVQDTWLWQMDATVPLEDQSHETFWRQLLRWTVAETPDPVEASSERQSVEAGEPATITATVADAGFVEVNGATVTARITTPAGVAQELAMDWSVEEDGSYAATFVPESDGIFEVVVDAAGRDSTVFGSARTNVRVAPSLEEFRDPHQRRGLLERVAEETSGRYYTLETVDQLAEDVRFAGGGVTVREERDLWDMPAVFLLLAGLLVGEWAYRRRRGLA